MIWEIFEPKARLQEILSHELGVSPVFAQVLLNRGITTLQAARDFLFAAEALSKHDPFLMKGMAEGAERITRAIDKKEKILIYGDYDVDGVTSIALLASVFTDIGAVYDTFIPNRLDEGYGLNKSAVTLARECGVKLIVTVDCGINSSEEVKYANELGIDVVITDHHELRKLSLPPAYAVIDPLQEDCGYPFDYLAGVGVAYKLARALTQGREYMADRHMDLVALGTIADIVPLNGENRILAKIGIKQLRKTEKAGLKALMDVAGITADNVTSRHIGFGLGPRINAIGRMASADTALQLLMCKNADEARKLAVMLDKENRNRQDIEKGILKKVFDRIEREIDLEKEKIIVLADEEWHPGIIGIVASRVTEVYAKPAILIALDGNMGKGSGRGIEGFNLFEAISTAGKHLTAFGGHRHACGLKIERKKIDLFRKELNEFADDDLLSNRKGLTRLKIDYKLPFSHISFKLVNELNNLMPYGPENEEPVFCSTALKVKTCPRDIGRNGFKFLVSCGSLTLEAVTFKKNTITKPRIGDIIDLAYTPSINTWDGMDTIQLNIRSLRAYEEAGS